MNHLREFWRSCHDVERAFFMLGGALAMFLSGWLWQAQRTATSLPPLFVQSPTALSNSSKTRGVQVHVSGAVKKAGVYFLPSHYRVKDAINASGGATSNAAIDGINLASRLEDGAKIEVPTKEDAHASNNVSSQSVHADKVDLLRQPLNVNTASAAELELLPGVGPALAQRIIDFRRQHGSLQSLDDLDQVKGLGSRKLEKIRPFVRF